VRPWARLISLQEPRALAFTSPSSAEIRHLEGLCPLPLHSSLFLPKSTLESAFLRFLPSLGCKISAQLVS